MKTIQMGNNHNHTHHNHNHNHNQSHNHNHNYNEINTDNQAIFIISTIVITITALMTTIITLKINSHNRDNKIDIHIGECVGMQAGPVL